MTIMHHVFRNLSEEPAYVSIEPWAHEFELEANEELRIEWEPRKVEVGTTVELYPPARVVVWPAGEPLDVSVSIDGKDAMDRNWVFKHRK